MKKIKYLMIFIMLIILSACRDEEFGSLNTGKYTDTNGELKNAATFPVGLAVEYYLFVNDEQYRSTVLREANSVTFGYQMKHGALVDDGGTIDFTESDAMFDIAENAGVEVFGHTLGWHQNQNATYLKGIAGGTTGGSENILLNGGFESGSGDNFDNWSKYNGGTVMTATTASNEKRGGNRALKVAVAAAGNPWSVQMASDPAPTTIGTEYKFTIWVKAASAGGNIRFSTQPSALYSANYNISTDWTLLTWTFTANESATRIILDMGATAFTYFVDDASLVDPNYTPPPLLLNGGFEAGTGDNFTNWNKYNGGTQMTAATIASEVRNGTRALKVAVPAAGNPWSVQLASDLTPTTIGKAYKFSVWAKATAAGGNIRFSTQPSALYSGNYNVPTDWALLSWEFTANEAATRIVFDMGAAAFTYLFDDARLVEVGSEPEPGGGAEAVDEALGNFITQTVEHYKGRMKAWDVVNEPMADGNSGLRTSANSNVPANATDFFFWSDYLGRDWALKAFEYAEAADPDALLFINDYNLESNGAKLDSLIAYVEELKQKGAKIDGIGTQMHISLNTSYAGIETMFRKLGQTGLKVRISELDIRINPNDLSVVTPDEMFLGYQAAMYEHVIKMYLQYVPAPQRHGITIWGVTDADSWIVVYQNKRDYPLLFDESYNKKPAYAGVLKGLKGQ
ncbi:endo-1,4-beta-xylanase [Pseudochryseolinea flava]|uniref:Beta-xylanase n=1 Tax=Pseudochryseolinea flava TaxID=2059302 RepID=A0A364XZI1_9BACT|nr:endo-1,4-beta-xylanase [Pseudochryseolinea flava]RAV99032.1 hypothetical protein DQQ10_20775 [Pseudochryseolinea flava]